MAVTAAQAGHLVLSTLHTNDAASAAIRLLACKEGLRPMRLAGAQKVADGLTTVAEVLRGSHLCPWTAERLP